MKPLEKLLPLYFIVFFGYIGYSLIITIFTPMLLYQGENALLAPETPKDLRILALGFLIFLYPFGQFISSPILGALSDRWGRRPLLLFSLIISTLMYACIGVGVLINSFTLIALSLLIAGLSEGNITIAQSTVADISPKEERGRYFGFTYLSASLSYIVGPLLGGKLADPPTYSPLTFSFPFFAVAILLLAVFFWIYFGFEESLATNKRQKIPYLEAFTNLLNLFYMKRFRFLFLVNFLLYLAIFGFFQGFPIYIVDHFKADVWSLALFIAWSAVPFLIVNFWLTGRLATWFTHTQVTVFAAIWFGIFLEILLIPQNPRYLWLTLFLVGLGAAGCLPSLAARLSLKAKETEQGRVMGINQSLQFFAEAFSGLVVGFLAAIFVKLALIIFGILSLIGASLLLRDFSLHEKS